MDYMKDDMVFIFLLECICIKFYVNVINCNRDFVFDLFL